MTSAPIAPASLVPSFRAKGQSKSGQRRIVTVLLTIALGVLAFTMLIPMLWMVLTSLKSEQEIYLLPPVILPRAALWDNYEKAFTSIPYWRMMLNSAIVAGTVTLSRVLTSTAAGYAFGRLEFPGRDKIFLAYIAVLMVPFTVTIVPLYLIVRAFGWIDTLSALIFPMFVSAYNTFLARQFMLSLPKDLDDAARIDGANPWVIFTRIILPLSRPVIAVITLFSFMTSWNSFIWPLLVLSAAENLTIPIGLAFIASGRGGTGEYVQWNYLMAAATAAATPIVALYVAAQRQFVQGIAMTGMRG